MSNLINLVIHPELEPGVIDNAMIHRALIEYGPKDEAGRLYAEQGVPINEVSVIRLEFQNIIRIDHLWMLKSLTKLSLAHNRIEKIENLDSLIHLTELDLSFNKIQKIENVEKLINLEVFTLFHNQIRKLENLDDMVKLMIFSIGDNLIEDFKEMAYLRRFRFLRSVSFQGNPCCSDPQSYEFIKAALTKITYLDYKSLAPSEREKGIALFRGLLRKLDEADEKTEKARLAKEEYDKKVEFYALSFVEYLSGPEMIETMFERDPDGALLLTIGGELLNHYEKYKEDYVEAMDVLVDYAQQAYGERQREIQRFEDLMKAGLADSVARSKQVLKVFGKKKHSFVNDLKLIIEKFQAKPEDIAEVEPEVMDLTEYFNDLVELLWKDLMTIEMTLFEQCEEARTQFGVNITEMVKKLHEHARSAFGMWRELETSWNSKQFDVLSKHLGNRALLGNASHELVEIMMDRDLLVNAIAQSSDNHMRFIDAREDLLMNRSDNWRHELINGDSEAEIKRNRDRILEINYYVDHQRQEWTDMQMALTETVDPETAALLGDDLIC